LGYLYCTDKEEIQGEEKEMSFLSDEEFAKIGMGMPKVEFEEFLERFLKTCVEETLKALPGSINHLIKSATTMQALSKKFYDDNPDLVERKEVVAKIMEKVEGEHPEMGLKSILNETGLRARQSLMAKEGFNMDLSGRPKGEALDAGFGDL
jgi:hypothetical protein